VEALTRILLAQRKEKLGYLGWVEGRLRRSWIGVTDASASGVGFTNLLYIGGVELFFRGGMV
jgi:hypothetical protein